MEHLNGNVRASYSTQGASGTFAALTLFPFSILGRMITLDVELVAYPDRILGARCDTQRTPLAQFPVNPNESLFQKSSSIQCFKSQKIRPCACFVKDNFCRDLSLHLFAMKPLDRSFSLTFPGWLIISETRSDRLIILNLSHARRFLIS